MYPRRRSDVATFIKDQNDDLLSNDGDIPVRWREYFKDHLNLSLSHYHIHKRFGKSKENTITAPDFFVSVKTMKAGKALGCD